MPLRAVIIKAILGLPESTATDLLYLPTDHLGMQFRSLIPEYVTVAAKSLVTSQEDKGRLGTLTRALSVIHIALHPKVSRMKYNMTRPDPAWKSSKMRGLTMRRAAWITTYGMHLQVPTTTYSLAAESADLKERIYECVRLQQLLVS